MSGVRHSGCYRFHDTDWLSDNYTQRENEAPSPGRQRQFAYRKLDWRLQRLVNTRLNFEARVRLRAASKLFSTSVFPSQSFFLDALYDSIHVEVAVTNNIYGQRRGRWRYCGVEIVIGNCPRPMVRIEISAPHWQLDTLHPDMAINDEGGMARIGIIERLTRNMKAIRVSGDVNHRFWPPQMNIPPAIFQLRNSHLFRRNNFAIYPVFGPGTALGDERYLRLDCWIPDGTSPGQALLSVVKLTPEEYLDVYTDAFIKLIDCPLLRFSHIYEKETDCLHSLPFFQQFVHHIIQSAIPNGEGRRLVILDIYTTQQLQQESLKCLSDEYEMMMARLIEWIENNARGQSIQLYQIGTYLGERESEIHGSIYPTGINIIIAQNYSAENQVITQIPWVLSESGRRPTALGIQLKCSVLRVTRTPHLYWTMSTTLPH